ncbi:MAG TPA: hypothetical protein VHG28_10745 [Longimicrobiaceae bacterium]|nr:hypothetical protein [Longimicrobiaceae bacterium]
MGSSSARRHPAFPGLSANTASCCIQANTYYRVSVNTRVKQAKTYAYLTNNGDIVNGPLTADYSYYGQPADDMPAQGIGSTYFVDIVFEES